MYASSFKAEGKVNYTCSGYLASMDSFLLLPSWAVRIPPPELAKDYDLLSASITLLAIGFTKLEAFLENVPMVVFRSAFASGGNFSVLGGRVVFIGCITRSV